MDMLQQYLDELSVSLEHIPLDQVYRLVNRLHRARMEGNKVFIMGNGGSASTASHFACDLGKNTAVDGLPNFQVIGLTDNMAMFSALANDEGYERVFVKQLQPLVKEKDVVIGISTSGNSENVLQAIDLANIVGATTVGLTGFDGGRLINMVDLPIHVPNDCIEQVEDIHLVLEHMVCKALREDYTAVEVDLQDLLSRQQKFAQGEAAAQASDPQPSLALVERVTEKLRRKSEGQRWLDLVLETALEEIGGQSGSLVTVNEGWEITDASISYNGYLQSNSNFQLEEMVRFGLAGWVIRNGKPALVHSTREDARWLKRPWEENGGSSRSAISVPLSFGDQVYGVITLVNAEKDGFSPRDLALLAILALYLTVAPDVELVPNKEMFEFPGEIASEAGQPTYYQEPDTH